MSETTMIYGYITDELFWKKKTVDLNKSVNTGIGYLDDILINYFNKIGTVYDSREERLDIIGEIPKGKISIYFDVSKMDPTNGPFINVQDEDIINLFNITEKCYITQNRSETEINDELIENSSLYRTYKNNSFKRSSHYTLINPDSLRNELKIYDYIEFEMTFNSEIVHFKLWLSNEAFKNNYPLTTITKVIPPCEPNYLLDPTQQTSAITSIIESSNSIFENVDKGTTDSDHTGTLAFRTKWVISSQNTPEIKFGLMYQGAVPSSLEAREAIRNYLLGLGIAPESTWENRFPDLFITAQFFLIPHWGNITERPNNKYGNVYPAIIDYEILYTNTQKILPTLETEWINENLEILTNPFNTIFLTCVPDPLNDTDKISLLKLLDTYQAFGPDDTNYDYQESNAKEFSRYLGTAMAVLYGESVPSSSGFTENMFYDRKYLSFSSNKIEYHVLFKEYYTIDD